ncbi:MAG: hypothetical protein J3R72DRAFT_488112 [Linnemannia gamsii]|nr:MAG: hypothetical protein J3R72DRAFT_488112 [Linnemannia gamsii]
MKGREQLSEASRAPYRKHYLDSLELDNFVEQTELDAIIATADAKASVRRHVAATATSLKTPTTTTTALDVTRQNLLGDFCEEHDDDDGAPGRGRIGQRSSMRSDISNSTGPTIGPNRTRPRSGRGVVQVPPTKALNTLIQESGITIQSPQEASYLTVEMGPSRYPARSFCSVCGWRGLYSCTRCGLRYCGLLCLKAHQDTRQAGPFELFPLMAKKRFCYVHRFH